MVELQRVKTQARAGLLRSLDSNMGMAQQLLEYEVKTGSWRNLFKQLDQIAAVTTADIQRVAKGTFTAENRTIGKLLSKDEKKPQRRKGRGDMQRYKVKGKRQWVQNPKW